ncbi:MAG: MASE3 domain-containing protein [bacterium]
MINNDLVYQIRNLQPEKIFGFIFRFVSSLILFTILFYISQHNYLFYHELAESFSIIIAFGIFFVIWNSYTHLENHFFMILAIGIVTSGFFDFLHMLSYKGMGIFELGIAQPSNLATQLWLVARIIQAGTYIVAPFFFLKFARWKVASLYALIAAFFTSVIFIFNIFPTAYFNNSLTPFKIITEFILTLILILASIIIYKKRNVFDRSVYLLLLSSFITSAVSEFSFSFYADVYGIINFIGHILKILAFYLLYRAIVVTAIKRPHDLLFHQLNLEKRKLKRNETKLKIRNDQLREEKSKINSLFSSIGDGIVAMNEEGRVEYVNPAFIEMIGLPIDEIRDKIISDILPLYNEYDQMSTQKTFLGCPRSQKFLRSQK